MFNSNNRSVDSYYEYSRNPNVSLNISDAGIKGELKADVVVIGGGLTGCSTALHLAEKAVDVALVEARHIGWGASGRSGGQIINGYSCGQEVLEKLVGLQNAKMLWTHSLNAVDYTRELVDKHQIDCDLTMGYLYAAVNKRKAEELKGFVEQLSNTYGYHLAEYLSKTELEAIVGSEQYHGGVTDPGSGHLHPLNYTLGIAQAAQNAGVRLYEQSTVTKVENSLTGKIVHFDGGSIHCNEVVYACNAYLDGLSPELGKKIMPVGTYIIATEPLKEEVALGLISNRAAICNTNFVLDYYRLSADNRLLFGGQVSYSTMEPMKLTQSLQTRMLKVFPQLAGVKIDFTWSGYVAITRNRALHLGQDKDGCWFVQGYSGHGMALTAYVGKILAEAVLGEQSVATCFQKTPHKNFPGGQLLRTPTLVAAMSYYKLRDHF